MVDVRAAFRDALHGGGPIRVIGCERPPAPRSRTGAACRVTGTAYAVGWLRKATASFGSRVEDMCRATIKGTDARASRLLVALYRGALIVWDDACFVPVNDSVINSSPEKRSQVCWGEKTSQGVNQRTGMSLGICGSSTSGLRNLLVLLERQGRVGPIRVGHTSDDVLQRDAPVVEPNQLLSEPVLAVEFPLDPRIEQCIGL